MKLRKFFSLATLVIAAASSFVAAAQGTVANAFKNAPASIIPLLSTDARLDMIDYFTSNMSTPSNNTQGGKSRIDALSPESMHVILTPASELQIVALPAGADSLIAIISTVNTPAPDSKISVYSADWRQNLTAKTFAEPDIRQWLTDEGKRHADEVEMQLPFMLVSYIYDPATATLTMTNNSESFLAREVYETISAYLRPTLAYRWNGKKFEPVR